MTRPFLPLSLPAMTTTRSFFLTLISTFISLVLGSNNLRREADDLHKAPLAQLARNRSKNASADRLVVGLDDYGGVLIEADIRPIFAPGLFPGANHDGAYNLSFFHRSIRRRLFHGGGNHVAQTCTRTRMTSDREDHRDTLGPGV